MDTTEEIRFRAWLRSHDAQPAEVTGDDRWNHNTVAATWDYVTDPLPATSPRPPSEGDVRASSPKGPA